MSLFSNIVSPNADIAALLAQQNLANRGGGGGSYSGAGIEDTLNLYAGQQGLAEQAMNRAEPRERRNALFQMAMQKDLARDKMALDREALEHAANLEEQTVLKSKILQLRLASAGQAEKQQIADEMAANENELARIADRRMAATATFASKNADVQASLGKRLNELKRTKELSDQRLNQFRSAFDTMGEGEQRRLGVLDNTLTQWMTNPAKAGGQTYAPLSLTSTGPEVAPGMNLPLPGNLVYGAIRMGEGIKDWFSNDPFADTAILQAYFNKPEVLQAAVRWGGKNGLRSLLPPNKAGGWMDTAMSDPQADANASKFAVELMSDGIVSALSSLGTGFNRDAAAKSTVSLLQELNNQVRNGATDPAKVTSAIMPLARQLAIDAYGSDQNVGEVVDMVRHSLTEMAKRESAYAREALKTPGSVGVDAVKNAAVAYSLGLAAPMKHVLGAATRGQVMDTDNYNLVTGMFEQAKEKEGGYRLAAIDETLPELEKIIGKEAVGQVRTGKGLSKELAQTEELLSRQEVEAQRKKAAGVKAIPGREGARQSAELAVLQELLKRSQAGR